MTQIPPPPFAGPPLAYGQPQPPPPTNAWAVVSLVCGIIGCLLITPLVAIVTGIIGLGKSRQQGGRGMSIAGIILGLLWCVVSLALVGGGVLIYNKGAAILSETAKPQTIALINRVAGGDLSKDPSTAALSDADLQSIADIAKPLGACQSISVNGSTLKVVNNVMSIGFDGTATFEHGTTPIHATMHNPNGRPAVSGSPGTPVIWDFDELKLK